MDMPVCQTVEKAPERLVLTLQLEPDMPCFEGHFEQLPVLAAVVQLDWALALARHHFNRPLVFRGLRSNKFQQLVRPPVQLRLTLELFPERQMLKFQYRNHLGVCSSGVIQLAEDE